MISFDLLQFHRRRSRARAARLVGNEGGERGLIQGLVAAAHFRVERGPCAFHKPKTRPAAALNLEGMDGFEAI